MNKFPCNILVLAFALGGAATAALAAAPTHPGPGMAAQATQSADALPAALQPAVYQALARDAGPAYAINEDGCARLSEPKLTACFDDGGVHFTGSGSPLALHLVAWGREPIAAAGIGRLTAVESVKPAIRGNEAQYRHGDLTEWWRVLPVGFEQGFTVAERPAGNGQLTLMLTTSRQDAGAPSSGHSLESGTFPPSERRGIEGDVHTGFRVPLRGPGMTKKAGTLAWGKLRYGKLVVTDARGNVVPATLNARGDRVLIAVNDANAAYPLTVDPLVWIEQKVTSPNSFYDAFGGAVVVSGETAMIGAPNAGGTEYYGGPGAVYVFEKSGGSWNLTQTLLPSIVAADDTGFGCSIAIKGDTALIGDYSASVNGDPYEGRAYVFTNSGATWTETQSLTQASGNPAHAFGASVALSRSTALIGAQGEGYGNLDGQAFVFTKVGGSWAQQQELLPPGLEGEGLAVALHGSIAFVSVPDRGYGSRRAKTGLVLEFANVNGTWVHSASLTAENRQKENEFGSAISVLGDKLLIGAPGDDSHIGAVYEFTWSGGAWTQTQKIVPPDSGFDLFGASIARSGNIALIGAPGVESAAYLFSDAGGSWNQVRKIVPADGTDAFGVSVALDGTQVLIGAPDYPVPGSAYFYTASNLDLAVIAPLNVGEGQQYVSQAIATNNANSASPAVTATMAVPAAASFVSADATQGSCSEAGNVVTCDFGQIVGNAGTATANVTLKATGNVGDTIDNTARIALATPPLTASAATTIGEAEHP